VRTRTVGIDRGRNAKLSEFRHDGVGWRYLRGDGALLASIADVDALTIDTFPG